MTWIVTYTHCGVRLTREFSGRRASTRADDFMRTLGGRDAVKTLVVESIPPHIRAAILAVKSTVPARI